MTGIIIALAGLAGLAAAGLIAARRRRRARGSRYAIATEARAGALARQASERRRGW
jgi:LPXTG-motif cell wall-anchored protein